MSIIIGADFIPTDSNKELFQNADIKSLLGDELLDILLNADYRIFNLETPLISQPSPIKKNGPVLGAPLECSHAYSALKVDLLTLANNHIMDHGSEGFHSTIKILEEVGIDWLGAGENIENIKESHCFQHNKMKFGVYACAEHEFSIADEIHPGANPYDPLESFDQVEELSELCDFTIVLYHGGKENYRYPTPMLQKRCRRFIEKGADLVVCQHSHCIGCEEKYMDGTIVYGQGNFLFDHSEKETWQTGILVVITNKQISYIPICKQGRLVRKASQEEKEIIMREFYNRSKSINEPGFIEKQFSELADQRYYDYMEIISGKRNKFFYRLLKKFTNGKFKQFFNTRNYDQESKLCIQNYIDCETHRELIIQGLKNKIHK